MFNSKISRALLVCLFGAGSVLTLHAQEAARVRRNADAAPPIAVAPANSAATGAAEETSPPTSEEVRRQLQEQRQELERMRAQMAEQTRVINELRQRVEQTEQTVSAGVVRTADLAASDSVTQNAPPNNAKSNTASGSTAPAGTAQSQDERLARIEEETRQNSEKISRLGAITFGGDIRVRYESLFGQLNASANAQDPAILGNPLTPRQRFRMRARFSIRGKISDEFEWGLRLATGSFADAISSNQTFTDLYNRKPFGLDQAYVTWMPRSVPGLRLQGGKFETPWVHTELTLDNDIQPEGFNESYSRGFKNSRLTNITLVAWQLPLLERNSAFARNANGTVNIAESRRAGRDLALYGAQARARFEFSKTVVLTLSAADLYFSGTQFISPVQIFGGNLLLPVTFTIPANGTTPAQTITTQVSIPRDLLVAGNGNLGISSATNNAVNRDGRLASGYNLIDLISRLELTGNKRFPVTLLFNFVTNTQVRDVVVAGAGGANQFLRNKENKGYWAEVVAGKSKERGDVQFGYTFIRIEKDAVLTPFNYSDMLQQSDITAHRFIFNYAADRRVQLSLTGIVSERPNGLLGVFGATPPDSLNRGTTRLQFDTIFSF